VGAVAINGAVWNGYYDYRLVLLSVVIAILASYTALDLGGRVTESRGRLRILWLGGGALAMGFGIWSMHYIGMLALRLPVRVYYDWPTVLMSLLAAICASGIALFFVSWERLTLAQALLASFPMGTAIAGMHYLGMMAMRMRAHCHYNFFIVATSIVLAVVISFVALKLTFRGRNEHSAWSKLISAMVMGAAIPAMHYTGMAAVTFTAGMIMDETSSRSIDVSGLGMISIIFITFLLLGLAILTSLLDRRFSSQNVELELRERRYNQILQTSFDAFVGMEPDGSITDWSAHAQTMLGYPASTAIGKRFSELILPPRQEVEFLEACAQLVLLGNDQETRRRFEMQAVCSDRREITVELTISSIQIGTKQHLAAFLRDITETKRAEQALNKAMNWSDNF
jgi:two-component system, sensor histidine kinase and response regulator